jgi:hypothetical protein
MGGGALHEERCHRGECRVRSCALQSPPRDGNIANGVVAGERVFDGKGRGRRLFQDAGGRWRIRAGGGSVAPAYELECGDRKDNAQDAAGEARRQARRAEAVESQYDANVSRFMLVVRASCKVRHMPIAHCERGEKELVAAVQGDQLRLVTA